MNIDELVGDELKHIKPQLTANEWFSLSNVIRASLYRILQTQAAQPVKTEFHETVRQRLLTTHAVSADKLPSGRVVPAEWDYQEWGR